MTRGRMPVSRSSRARNSPPFRASRVALVAAATISSTWCESAIRLNFESACNAAFIASGVRARPSRPPAPSRTIAFSRSVTSKERSGRTRTTIMWTEFVPISIAAMRIELSRTPIYSDGTVSGQGVPVIMRTPAAEYLIRQRVAALTRALPAAKDGDAKSLHQARVATRRLRAALPVFGTGRKAEKVTRCVRRLTRVLGPARELDVSLLILDELENTHDVPRSAIYRLRGSIADERRRLQDHVRERLDEFDIHKVRKRAIAVARKGVDKTPRDAEAVAWARERATRRVRRLDAAIEHAAGLYLPDRLHDVRIAIKKLRYTLELNAGRPRNVASLRTLKSMQDLLGRMHDLEVLIARTRSIQSSPGASTLKMSADLDRLVRRLETECRQLHGHYMAARPKLVAVCDRLMRDAERSDRARSSAA